MASQAFFSYDLKSARITANSLAESQNSLTIEERKLLTRIDIRIIPILSLFYLLSFLDRGNLANAAAEGMAQDLKLSNNDLDLELDMFNVGFCLFAVPSMVVLKRTSPSAWLSTILGSWGVIMTLMGIVQGQTGMLICRLLCGVFESGLLPGIAYLLSTWYRREELEYRMALFYASASAIGAFGGLLALGISKMQGVGGLEGWRWIFILEGSASVVAGSLGYMLVHNYPSDVNFLTIPEKQLITSRARDQSESEVPLEISAISNEVISWHDIKETVMDWQVWAHTLILLCVYTMLKGADSFLPRLMHHIGYGNELSELLSVPVNVTASICCVLIALLSDKIGCRSAILVLCFIMSGVGYLMNVLASTHDRGSIAYAGMFLVTIGSYGALPCSIVWLSNNIVSSPKRSVALSIQIGIGNLGGVISNYISCQAAEVTSKRGRALSMIFVIVGFITVIAVNYSYNKINNKRQQEILQGIHEGVHYDSLVALGDRNPHFRHRF